MRSVVAYVGQEPVIFATLIAENLRYGKPGATQDELEGAVKMANAHNFIMSFQTATKHTVVTMEHSFREVSHLCIVSLLLKIDLTPFSQMDVIE